MKARALLLAVLALIVGVATVRLARSWLAAQQAALATSAPGPAKPASVRILVAAHDLPTGAFLRAGDVRWQAWPEAPLDPSYLVEGRDKQAALTGAVVRARIAAGEPVGRGRVIAPGERGFLAAVLLPGDRAVTVPVTATTEVGGLVFPGDRVDLILSHLIRSAAGASAPARSASETVLTDLRVLAVDQTTDDVAGKPVLAKTATFEATPKQAEAIEVASQLGQLSLSLRSLAGEGAAAALPSGPVSHTWDSDVSPLLRARVQAAPRPVTVLRGEVGRRAAAAPAPPAPKLAAAIPGAPR